MRRIGGLVGLFRVLDVTVKTAVVAPAVVYGVGRGPGKTSTFPLFGAFLKHKKVFCVALRARKVLGWELVMPR